MKIKQPIALKMSYLYSTHRCGECRNKNIVNAFIRHDISILMFQSSKINLKAFIICTSNMISINIVIFKLQKK